MPSNWQTAASQGPPDRRLAHDAWAQDTRGVESGWIKLGKRRHDSVAAPKWPDVHFSYCDREKHDRRERETRAKGRATRQRRLRHRPQDIAERRHALGRDVGTRRIERGRWVCEEQVRQVKRAMAERIGLREGPLEGQRPASRFAALGGRPRMSSNGPQGPGSERSRLPKGSGARRPRRTTAKVGARIPRTPRQKGETPGMWKRGLS